MASIDKLKIQGVRNFGVQTGEIISFEAPLTLIVGYNGSGKTTIIECLKYATTGQLPPNSKSGAFVHDPKLIGEKEVMAQVKLQFKNHTGHRMVITRSLQVQVKKTGLPSMKTLECQLMMNTNGERTSVSKRVAELDKVVPDNLGVSAAILNTVIFCHQDESLWPMSEPSKLKKQFDDIFEAQQYTKAVDTLKAMRKVRVSDGGLLKQTEEHTKIIKDKAERARKQMEALFEDMEALHDRLNALGEEMNAAKIISDQKRHDAHIALGAWESLRNKKERAKFVQENLASLESNLQEFAESDAWLESTLEKYSEKMAQYQEQYDDYTSQYTEVLRSIQNSRDQLAIKQAENGRQQAAKDAYEMSIKSRATLIKEATRNHSIRGYEGDLTDTNVKDFTDRLRKALQEKDRELDAVKKDVDDELAKCQVVLDELNSRRTTATQKRVNALQVIATNKRKIERQQADAERVRMTEGTKASLDASLADIQGRVSQLKSEIEAAGLDTKLKTQNSELRELESEQERLSYELLQCNKLAESRAALEYTKNHAKELQSSLDIQKSTYHSQFTALFGPEWSVSNLEDDFRDVLETRSQALVVTRKQQQALADELSEVNLRLKTQKANLVKKKDDRQKSMSIVLASITTADNKAITSMAQYEPELESLKTEYEDFMKDFDGMNYISEYYVKAKDVVNKHNACKLCERPFSNPKEKLSALDKLNGLIAKYATEKAEEERQHLSDSWKKASDAKFPYDLYKTLTDTEIPSIENEVGKLEDDRGPLVKRLEQKDAEVGEKESAVRNAESQRAKINSVANLASQIAKNEDDIARASTPQSIAGVTQSVDELGEQIDVVKNKIATLRSKITKMQSDKDNAMSNLNALERDESASRQRSRDAKYEMDKKQAYLANIAELEENSSQSRGIIQAIDAQLEELLPLDSKARAQYGDIKLRGKEREKGVQADKDDLASTVNQFQMVTHAINAYIEDGGPAKLAACQRAIKAIDKEIAGLDTEQKQITKDTTALKSRMDDSGKTKRSMEDNLACRKARRDLESLQREIAELESQDHQVKYEQLDREANAATQQFQKATAERATQAGKLQSKDEQYQTLQQEWDTDYHDAIDKYKESHIRVAANTAACDDLAKFTKALDEAIMKYHTVKMQEINAVAGELWRSTYQGTDVDTIMIKSETENAANKRAINYRLVMIKQDSEMDMRGRCSAGQRVLACIIIRLALAECFGINCGVIALDEPTTNLDSDNIKALAISLNQIIHHRRHQKNFQLIIITHDEEFLKHMRCNEFTDHYYRVFRDNNQRSSIDKQPISELSDG